MTEFDEFDFKSLFLGPVDNASFSYPDGANLPIDYRSKIHEEVHKHYKVGEFTKEFNYDLFFAATDTLLDVGNILSMAERTEWPKNKYLGQLWMYGVLQALAVEQQATRQLLTCFGYPKKSDFLFFSDELKLVNEIRIAVAGHPSNHNNANLDIRGCSFLGQRVHGTLTKFTIVTYENFKSAVMREVDVLDLIERQSRAIEANLCLVWTKIKQAGCIEVDLFSKERP